MYFRKQIFEVIEIEVVKADIMQKNLNFFSLLTLAM